MAVAPMNFASSLTQYLPNISTFLNNPTTTGLPRTAEQAGGMALLGYAMRPQEDITVPSIYDSRSPYGTSSVNYLQGLYQSPSDPFAPGGIYEQYLPLLNQQKTSILNDAQQRIIAGLPGGMSTSMGGSEIGSIGEALQNRIAPSYQALFADLSRENMARQQNAANTVYGGENQLNQIGFAAEIEAALSNARSESERNAILGALGTALLLSGRTGGAAGVGTAAGQPGAQQGGIGQALQSFLGGGTSGMGQYAPIGQMSVADIIGQMQAGTLTSAQGLALIAKTQGLGLLGTAGAGFGVGGALGGWIGPMLPNEATAATAGGAVGAAGGALTGAALGTAVFPGVGTAIGAVVGGIAGLFGGAGFGFLGEQSQQQDIKAAALQADIAGNTSKTQHNGDFFLQQLQTLGVDTSAYQQFVQAQVANAAAGEEPFSFQGISGTADQSYAVAITGGQLLLQAIQQRNPSITSLAQVPGLRDEFISYMLGFTFQGEGLDAGGHLPLSDINVTSGFAGLLGPGSYSSGGSQYQWLAEGGTLPAGGEFIVGERGPELLRAAPGTQVLPMMRGPTNAWSFDPQAANRNVMPPIQIGGPGNLYGPPSDSYTPPFMQIGGSGNLYGGAPPNVYLPRTSLTFEGPPARSPYATTPGQALIGQFDPRLMTPGSVPAMIASLRLQGMFPGQGSSVPGMGRSSILPPSTPQRPPFYAGRPSFAGSRPSGARGQSTLATALQQNRTRRRKPNATTNT